MLALPPVAPLVSMSSVSLRVASGPQRRTLWLTRPAGVVLVSRLIVPRGVVASLSAEIPRVAGIGVDTTNAASNICRHSTAVDVCTRWQAECPMPAARWRVTLDKRSGPAGFIRFVFVVG